MKIKIDGIEVLIEDADQYLQINDICEADLNRVWTKIKTDYEKYDKWFCYHNTEIPFTLLNEIGAVLKDDCIEMRATVDDFSYYDTLGIVQVEDEGFDEFAAYHDEHHPEMYWTSERIKRDLSRWGIFVLWSDNRITGYILIAMWNPVESEIFYVDASDSFQCKALITFAIKYVFDNGRKEVLYMADDNTISQNAASSVGFITTGFYKGYIIKCML